MAWFVALILTCVVAGMATGCGDDQPDRPDASEPDSGRPRDAGSNPSDDAGTDPEDDAGTIDEPFDPDAPLPAAIELPPTSAGPCAFEPVDPSVRVNNAECPEGVFRGDLRAMNAADLERLRGCRRMIGNLTLELIDLENPSPLQSLRVVDGDVWIRGKYCNEGGCSGANEQLTSLRGLHNLRCVSGDLDIDQRDLEHCKPLDLTPLRRLIEVGGHFTRHACEGSRDDTFESLQRVWGNAIARYTFKPPRLTKVYGALSVESGEGPSSTGLYVGCDAGQEPCRDGVYGCDLLTQHDITRLTNCEQAVGHVRTALSTTSLAALSKLRRVRRELQVGPIGGSDLGPLTTLAGLEALEEVGTLILSRQPSVENLHPLRHLTRAGAIVIDFMTGLRDLTGLEGVTRAPEGISLMRNAGLTSLSGLNVSGPVRKLEIAGGSITNLSALAAITGPVENLTLALTMLQNVDALSGIREIGVLSVSACDALTSLSGLNLASVRKIELSNNANLASLQGLLSSSADTVDLEFRTLPRLTTLTGLGGLRKAAWITIHDCDALGSMQGLEGLREVERITITDNKLLTQVRALGSITDIRRCEISDNPSLDQCEIDWLDARLPSGVSGSDNGPAPGTCAP